MAVAAWVLQVLTAAPAVAAAVDDSSRPVQLAMTTTAWAVWAVGLGSLLIPSTISCTAVRLVAPLPLAAVVVGAIRGASGITIGVAAAGAFLALGTLLSAEIGRVLVQGSAYGDEARFLLRPPTLLMLTMVPLAWLVAVAPVLAAVALLAARQWVLGVALALVGAAGAVAAARRLHRLSRRWLVFVPAGVVVHDQFAMAETAMFRRSDVRSIAAAEVGTTALDLSAGAAGLVVEIALGGATPVVPQPAPGRPNAPVTTAAVLICPTQPGKVVAEFTRRWQRPAPV